MWFGKKRGSYIFTDLLIQAGIKDLITLPGAQLLSIWDDAARSSGLNITVPRNEWNGVWMAVGYGIAGNGPALVSNTLGPGASNELPALLGSGYCNAHLLTLNLRQPPEKLGHIERVFQGINTSATHAPWSDYSFSIRNISDIKPVLEKARNCFISAKKNRACRVRIDLDFPLLFQKFYPRKYKKKPDMQNKVLTNKLNQVQTAPPAFVKNKCLLAGPQKWVKSINKLKALKNYHINHMYSHKSIMDPDYFHSIAFGYLLSGSKAAIVQTNIQSIFRDLDTLLLLHDHGIKITICAPAVKNGPTLDDANISRLKSILPFNYLAETALKIFSRMAIPEGLVINL